MANISNAGPRARQISMRMGRFAHRAVLGPALALSMLLAIGSSLFAAGGVETVEPNDPIRVYASVAPQAYFIRRIGGDHVDVGTVIGPGQDAHTYDPSPREIERLGSAEILFTTGLEYEAKIVSTLERARTGISIVDLTQGIALRELEAHWHDPTVPHSHENEPGDPHIWLGPEEVRTQAATIRDTLSRARPDLSDAFVAGYQRFMDEVESIEAELADLLADLRGSTVLVYHPAFGYFTDHFGMSQLAIEAGGREPSPRLLEVTIEKALAAGVETVFTQPEYDEVASRAVARAIGARTAVVAPLGEDWPQLMRSIGEALAGQQE